MGLLNAQYAHDVVLTSMRRHSNVMDVVWTSKRRRVLTGRGSHGNGGVVKRNVNDDVDLKSEEKKASVIVKFSKKR